MPAGLLNCCCDGGYCRAKGTRAITLFSGVPPYAAATRASWSSPTPIGDVIFGAPDYRDNTRYLRTRDYRSGNGLMWPPGESPDDGDFNATSWWRHEQFYDKGTGAMYKETWEWESTNDAVVYSGSRIAEMDVDGVWTAAGDDYPNIAWYGPTEPGGVGETYSITITDTAQTTVSSDSTYTHTRVFTLLDPWTMDDCLALAAEMAGSALPSLWNSTIWVTHEDFSAYPSSYSSHSSTALPQPNPNYVGEQSSAAAALFPYTVDALGGCTASNARYGYAARAVIEQPAGKRCCVLNTEVTIAHPSTTYPCATGDDGEPDQDGVADQTDLDEPYIYLEGPGIFHFGYQQWKNCKTSCP